MAVDRRGFIKGAALGGGAGYKLNGASGTDGLGGGGGGAGRWVRAGGIGGRGGSGVVIIRCRVEKSGLRIIFK